MGINCPSESDGQDSDTGSRGPSHSEFGQARGPGFLVPTCPVVCGPGPVSYTHLRAHETEADL
eukprot:2343043-Rhodomonas_salina.1